MAETIPPLAQEKVDATKKRTEEFLAFRSALKEESDRGCALFAAAYLDDALEELLTASLVQTTPKKFQDDLFDANAPLGSFSARIKLAFYLGKISRECRSDLDMIRNIRNDFAHRGTVITFEDRAVADRCRNLSFSHHERDWTPRGQFTSAASATLAKIHMQSLFAEPPAQPGDDRPTEEQKAEARLVAAEKVQQLLDNLIEERFPARPAIDPPEEIAE